MISSKNFHRVSDTAVLILVQRFSGSAVQRFSGSAVQRFSGSVRVRRFLTGMATPGGNNIAGGYEQSRYRQLTSE